MKPDRMGRRYDRLLGPDVASDVDQEIRFHIDVKAEELVAQGWTEDEARREAERLFGNVRALQHEGERIGHSIERRKRLREHWSDVLQDTRYGFRKLANSPGFALFAILTLALGIGLCSVIYSFLNSTLRPLPAVPQPERLAMMQAPVPYPWFQTYRDRGSSAWKAAAFMALSPFNVSTGESSERVTGSLVSPEYFDTLGVHPQLGRFFNVQSEQEGGAPVVIVTDHFWRTRLHSDPGAAGRRLRVNGLEVPILGVCPPGFFGTGNGSVTVPDLFVPVTSNAAIAPELRDNVLHREKQPAFWVLLRLNPGVTMAAAEAQLDAMTRVLQGQPQQKGKLAQLVQGGTVLPLPKEARAIIYIFYTVLVAAILGLICANLGGLMLARGAARVKEIAIRLSIGANRFRVVRQLVTESAVLAVLGGVAGFVAAILLFKLLRSVQADSSPLVNALTAGPDWKAALFTFVISALVALGFGLIPAIAVTGVDAAEVMKSGQFQGAGGKRRKFGIRNLFVAGQVTAAMTLVLIAGFMVLGFRSRSHTDLGFDTAPLSVFSVDTSRNGLSGPESAEALRRIPERLARLGGVEAVSLADGPPASKSVQDTKVTIPSVGDRLVAVERVGPGFLRTIGATIVRGTDFKDQTLQSKNEPAEILPIAINQIAATDFFGSADPLGVRIRMGDRRYEIAAVVRYSPPAPIGGHSVPVVLLPFTTKDLENGGGEVTTVVIRARAPIGIAQVNQELAAIDPRLTAFDAQTMAQFLAEVDKVDSGVQKFYAPFGVFALILACLGLAGVTAQTVQRRKKEIGIRMALGARRVHALRLVMGEAMMMVLSGAVLGFLAASGLARILAAVSAQIATIIGPSVSDPRLTIGVPLLFFLLSAAACYVPARRAATIDPIAALREE